MLKKELDYNSKKLSYLTAGEGPVVVLIHGFGEDASVWKNQVPVLNNYKLIIPYLPGSGNSEMIDDMSMEGMAEAVNTIIDSEISSSSATDSGITMIGHSLGGYITLAYVEKYKNRLKGFGVFHSTAFADNEEKIKTRKKGIDFIKSQGAFNFLKTTIPNLYAPQNIDVFGRNIDEHIEGGRNFSANALVSYYESMIKRKERIDVLKNSDIPVLFVLGKFDNAVPLEDGLKQCYLPQKSYIHILTKSGHMGMIEEKSHANILLHNFLKN